ncbi:MAG: chemotaxis protein CheW [Longimicrobiaceae bacterium]
MGAERASQERMVLLSVAGHRFTVGIEEVREVIPARPVTPLPGSEPFVRGLINLRGRLVTVLDLGARLNLPPAGSRPGYRVVVLSRGEQLVGLAADQVLGIVNVDPAELDSPAAALRDLGVDPGYVRGLGREEGGIFVALDTDRIFAPVLL